MLWQIEYMQVAAKDMALVGATYTRISDDYKVILTWTSYSPYTQVRLSMVIGDSGLQFNESVSSRPSDSADMVQLILEGLQQFQQRLTELYSKPGTRLRVPVIMVMLRKDMAGILSAA